MRYIYKSIYIYNFMIVAVQLLVSGMKLNPKAGWFISLSFSSIKQSSLATQMNHKAIPTIYHPVYTQPTIPSWSMLSSYKVWSRYHTHIQISPRYPSACVTTHPSFLIFVCLFLLAHAQVLLLVDGNFIGITNGYNRQIFTENVYIIDIYYPDIVLDFLQHYFKLINDHSLSGSVYHARTYIYYTKWGPHSNFTMVLETQNYRLYFMGVTHQYSHQGPVTILISLTNVHKSL